MDKGYQAMIRKLLKAGAGLALLAGMPAWAALPAGSVAPLFSTKAAKGGKVMAFSLRAALAKGPVVLYFYPKAFTQGCTLEARAFAEAIGAFEAEGATVLGLSADDIDTLKRFSTEECAGRFPVGVASPEIIAAYDVALRRNGVPTGLSDRTSYVISRDGRIRFVHSDLDHRDHVRLTLAAVRQLKSRK
ncbi:MAG: peroxiredoxin [Novosphingobium sp.]|nr:peroxiredoxin [Novosphingobium sp.]